MTIVHVSGALLALGLAACSSAHHVEIDVPETSPGSAYTCGVVTDSPDGTGPHAVNCTGGGNSNPAADNRSKTAFVNLPKECKGRINRIVIHDADSDKPTVHVFCATADNPITVAPH